MNRKIETEMIYIKSMKPHYHSENLEIILVLQGSLTIHKMERNITITKGQFVIINRHVVHYVESDGAYVLSCKIRLSDFKEIFPRMEYVEFLNDHEADLEKNPLVKRMDAVVVDLLLNIFIYKDKHYMHDELDFYMFQLVHLLFTSYQLISKLKNESEFINDDLYDRYYYVIEYIFEHIHEKIIADDIIQHLYMNPTYFSQFVKRVGGVGFKELVLYRKLMYITSYLLNPSLSMCDIALQVGITDMKSLYNIFKKFYKISPAKWRQKILTIKDDYVYCHDDYILKNFIEENHVNKHRENTVSKLYKYLIIEPISDYHGATVILNPYADMGLELDKDYQAYKFSSSLVKKLKAVNLKLCLQFPYYIMKNEEYLELMKNFMSSFMLSEGMNEVRKWRIELVVKNMKDLKSAELMRENLVNEMEYLNVKVVLDV